MILLLIASVLAVSNGLPQLYSNIGSLLSGEHCPDNVKITCNVVGFGTDGTLTWYVGNKSLAQCHNLRMNNKFPQNVMVDSSILNATVEISYSNISNNRYNFENFTLTAQLNDLLSIQGQNIACGTFFERSNVFSVYNFSILENVQNVTYLAEYSGEVKGELTQIHVQWIDGFDFGKCEINTTYVVQLLSSLGQISRKILSTESCTSSQCSVQFQSPDLDKRIERYEINVTASNQWLNSFSSSDTIWNTTGNLISFDNCNNTVSITCSTSVNENCSFNSTESASLATIQPGEIFLLETIPEVINIIIDLNSTILIETITYDIDPCLDTSESQDHISITAIVLSVISVVLSFLLGIFLVYIRKKRSDRDKIRFSHYKVKFGKKRSSSIECKDKCTFCPNKYFELKKNEEGVVEYKELWKEDYCNTCGQSMCKNCFKMVYLKYCKKDSNICKECFCKYKKEIHEITNIEQFGTMMPRKPKSSKLCEPCKPKSSKLCEECNHEYCHRRNTRTGYKVKKDSFCPTCGRWVCENCLHQDEVMVDYLMEKRKLCQDCYDISKMKESIDRLSQRSTS